MESSAGLDALIPLEGAARDAEDNHHRGHEGTQGKAKIPTSPKIWEKWGTHCPNITYRCLNVRNTSFY